MGKNLIKAAFVAAIITMIGVSCQNQNKNENLSSLTYDVQVDRHEENGCVTDTFRITCSDGRSWEKVIPTVTVEYSYPKDKGNLLVATPEMKKNQNFSYEETDFLASKEVDLPWRVEQKVVTDWYKTQFSAPDTSVLNLDIQVKITTSTVFFIDPKTGRGMKWENKLDRYCIGNYIDNLQHADVIFSDQKGSYVGTRCLEVVYYLNNNELLFQKLENDLFVPQPQK